ncbi:oxygen-insensitive NAD(P)H nitroreductase [Ferrimonas sediminicola]|uniref:Oxygen-insensitive NAD(P)H nitroreductase n=1 Tax=Ferrimonas sediminicola TaxID=2569538 RepID=A0A4V5NY54_9GAMM|nr:oxygen-insensitive NAD(P)H nitroreductase [Ferrimonas sediminicola]TKB48834.1 oxygen-insensitive NAD(P)H nitroreductase [Ferrimonas sediminicola]
MNLKEVVQARYSTKEFDPSKIIPAEKFDQIRALLRFSPSSVNSQPWHFVIADSEEGRQRIAKGTQGFFSFNEAKVLNASHIILFCAKTEIDDDYTRHLLETEDRDGRFAEPEHKEMAHLGRSTFVNIHRFDLKDAQHWMEKQLYLNMGTVLLGAAALGLDALPIEGLDTRVLNQEFDLLEKGYTAVAMVALGYRKESDFNASLPKSRLTEQEIFTQL